ncbi:MAG: LIC_13355 family lipoprotein [Sandaracinaceae bacterium]|nr:LIC_13355 family lipoprotein [Sandaracinaceae bacterium]
MSSAKRTLFFGALIWIGGGGCEKERIPPSPQPILADTVIEAPGANPSQRFGDPMLAINGVRGGGLHAGSTDVYSLDYNERTHITLAFDGGRRAIFDGPGADLVVFENAFQIQNSDRFFMDPVIVEVSSDGINFRAFPHEYRPQPGVEYDPRPEAWIGFAGTLPVLLHAENNPLDPFDPVAGGNAFDLADLGRDPEAQELLEKGIRYVRLTSAAIRINPQTGRPYPRDPLSNGADIDGVFARHTLLVR